ncbi:peptidylprolyl isomerase [Acinetobacter rudis]|uniref:Chaperone SurA n=1 Tax=Acinetobacter rudis CIP 110305 TaxID=421052 RepID=S3NJ01_9GAMM|nr:peptidylprolyl isomerase [Acinetobacter rudis]EPF74289.1 peptidyl-prolyl cis-trans isomerase SurA [Acinetobacter rudis CIP 110305]
MKTNNLKKLFQATVLSLAMTSSVPVFAEYNDQVVAVVGNSAILQSDLEQSVAEALHQLNAQKKEIPPENVLRTQLLNQLILQNAQLEQVKRYGLKLDEKALNDAVMSVAQKSGANSLEAFQQKLDGIAPGAYELLRSRIANDLLIQRLRQQQVMSRIKISDQDVENFLKSPEGQAAVGSQAHVLHVRVSGGQNAAELQKVAQQVKTELNQTSDLKLIEKKYSTGSIQVQGADMGYRALSGIPGELAARVSVLNPGQTSELITVQDGVHVLKLIDRKSDEQKALVPQYKTRHILIKTSEIVSADNAKQMIDSIYKRLQAGEDFSTLAATYSNDPGSAQDGGNLGWVSPGMMVPEFDQHMQNIAVNQITEPFQTQFGWHVLQVTDTRQQDMTHEYQQRMARQILGERQFDTEVDAWLRELRSNTYVEIKDPNLDPRKANKS